MATSRKRQVEIDVVVDDAKARAQLKNIGDTAETQGGRLKSMGDKAKLGFAALALGAGVVVDFLKEAALAAAEDERAQADLALALQNTVGATEEQISATEEFIKQTALATGVADDELRPALESLARATGDLDEAQGLLATAMDISAATGKPLQTVIDAMSKAINNNAIGALGRLGLKVKDAEGSMLTFDEVMQEAQRTMGGAMETAAETGAGSIARLQVRWEEAKESLGAVLIPALVDSADKATNFFAAFDEDVNLGWSQRLSAAFQTFMGESTDSVTAYIEQKSAANEAADAADDYGVAIGEGADVLAGYNKKALEGADATRELTDAQTAAADPAFALFEAQRRAAEAQERYNEAIAEFGPKSNEAEDAAIGLATAHAGLEGAAARFAEEGGAQSIDALRNMLADAGVLPEIIQRVIDQINNLNRTPITTRFQEVIGHGSGSGRTYRGGRARGGPVAAGGTYLVGEEGPELLTMGASGHVTPNNALGGPQVIQLVVDGRVLAETVTKHQVRDQRRNGTTGIR